MFDRKNVKHYLLAISLLLVATYIGNSYKNYVNKDTTNYEYDMIKEYLLNDSPLYGMNKPKLWIHSKYEINSRKWLDFQSRNTTNLNQPYLHITIQSIINHCSDDFHICLIDDKTFSKLLPGWDIDLPNVADPMKSDLRDIALLKLIYTYGGMIVPDSFLCCKNLINTYNNGIENDLPFMSEIINKTYNYSDPLKPTFIPDIHFMGSNKKNPIIELIINFHKNENNGHFTSEFKFTGNKNRTYMDFIEKNKMNLINGKTIGVKSLDNKPILIEDLLEDKFLDLCPSNVGILIPKDELLIRQKYNWFVYLTKEEIYNIDTAITRYIKESEVNSLNLHKNKYISSITSI